MPDILAHSYKKDIAVLAANFINNIIHDFYFDIYF